jgi:hypothetical protein
MQTESVISWPSRSLPWLLPSLWLNAPLNRPIVLISPWVEDVKIIAPVCVGRTTIGGMVRLSILMDWIAKHHGKRFVIYVREDQLFPSVNYRINPLMQATQSFTEFLGIKNLHGKLTATDTVVLETSANMLTASLYRNIETATTRSNPDSDSLLFINKYLRQNDAVIS